MTVRDRLASFQADVSRELDAILARADGEIAAAAAERERAAAEGAALQERYKSLVDDFATAVRHKEMFRRALYVYLQERDGPAGAGAPTPETLALIRQLLEDAV